jgi:hypothetical protein
VQVLGVDREVCGGGKGVGVELNQANTNKKIKLDNNCFCFHAIIIQPFLNFLSPAHTPQSSLTKCKNLSIGIYKPIN